MSHVGYLSLITSENAREVQSITGIDLKVSDLKKLISTDPNMFEARKALASAYNHVEEARKVAWREVLEVITESVRDMNRDVIDATQIRQSRYSDSMHKEVQAFITNLASQQHKKMENVWNALDKATKDKSHLTLNQAVHIVEGYTGDVVREVASTMGYDPSQRGDGNSPSARQYHILAAEAIAVELFEANEEGKSQVQGVFEHVVLAALNKAKPELNLGKHEIQVRQAITKLKAHIYSIAESNKEWGLAPIISTNNSKETPAPKVSYWDRVQKVTGITSAPPANKPSKAARRDSPARQYKGGNKPATGLGGLLRGAINNSAPTGTYDEEDVKREEY